MIEHHNLNRLAYFAAVVDTGSFTRAADKLGITKAVVSQQVARLESEAGATLLVRNTRRVHPTEAGQMLYARCRVILREAANAFGELAEAAAEPQGTLRITAPYDYGMAIVVPVTAAFSRRYAKCHVELTLTDQTLDLSLGELDIAIRLGWPTDSSLRAQRIGSFRQFLVGGAAFADRIRAATVPEDLAELPFVANVDFHEPLEWQFSQAGLDGRVVRMQAAVTINSAPAVLAAVRGGAGLSVLPDFLVAEELASARLVRALPQWQLPIGGIRTVYPAARFRPPKVTAFVRMLADAERRRAATANASA